MGTQLMLDFTERRDGEQKKLDCRDDLADWLVEMAAKRGGTNDYGADMARIWADRLYRVFGKVGMWDRGKVLFHFITRGDPLSKTTPDRIGVFDPGIDYHVVWDRVWAAAAEGIEPDDAARLSGWDYKLKQSEGKVQPVE